MVRKGNISWMKGKKHSKEAKEKNRQAHLKIVDRNQGQNFGIMDSDWAKLIGYLLSDGYWAKNQTLKFVNNNLAFVEEVKKLAKRKGFFLTSRVKNKGIEIHLKAFEKQGQNTVKGKIKEAPWRSRFRQWKIYSRDSLGVISDAPKNIQISFLQSYFNGDGYLWVGKDRSKENRITRIEIGFSIGIHKNLAEEIQKMLSSLGINSIIKSEWMKKSTRPFYRVLVAKRGSGKRLLALLDDQKYPEKFDKAKKLMEVEKPKFSRDKKSSLNLGNS